MLMQFIPKHPRFMNVFKELTVVVGNDAGITAPLPCHL
jgi:hypothetical protein